MIENSPGGCSAIIIPGYQMDARKVSGTSKEAKVQIEKPVCLTL
jgi:hypothetical protein